MCLVFESEQLSKLTSHEMYTWLYLILIYLLTLSHDPALGALIFILSTYLPSCTFWQHILQNIPLKSASCLPLTIIHGAADHSSWGYSHSSLRGTPETQYFFLWVITAALAELCAKQPYLFYCSYATVTCRRPGRRPRLRSTESK